MANLKHGAKLPKGSFLEIEIDGISWKISRHNSGAVTFEVYTSIGYAEIEHPPEPVQRIWDLVRLPAEGKLHH